MTVSAADKVYPSWDEIHDATAAVASKIDAEDYDLIVGISRGGLIPAAILASELNIRNVTSLTARSYEGDRQGGLTLSNLPDTESIKGKRILLVDDIADTGVTLRAVVAWLQDHGAEEVSTVVIYVNAQKGQATDFSYSKSTQWIVFPWENLRGTAATAVAATD